MVGYETAFYAVAELLGITSAQPLSPKHVWETQMLPRLRDMAARSAWSPTDDTLRSIIHYATHQALPTAEDGDDAVIARARTQVQIADFIIGAIRAREHGTDHFGDLYFHDDRPVAPEPKKPDYEFAWRELHGALEWMQGHKALNRYLGWNFAKIANDLIDRAYPGLRQGTALAQQGLSAATVERPSDDDLDPHLPETVRSDRRCGIQRSPWLSGWFVPWSPRNDNENAEGPWSHWVALAHAIIAADGKARATLANNSHQQGSERQETQP